jgi:hypothetical protein
MNQEEREIAVHKAHCFMIVQPENEFMGCKYGPDEECPVNPHEETIGMTSMGLRQSIADLIIIDEWFACSEHGSTVCKCALKQREDALNKIMPLVKDHVVYVIGDNELVQKTDDIQEIDVSMNNAEVINEEKATQRNRAGAY